MKTPRIPPIRHEYGLWSLLRTDKNLRYILKSLRHRRQPATHTDARHFTRVHNSLACLGASESGTRRLRLSAVGDLMWLRSGWESFLSPTLKAHLDARPLRFANLETPIHTQRAVKKYAFESFHYNAPASYLAPWQNKAAKTVFSLCNNHALDQGLDGLRLTREAVTGHNEFAAIGGVSEADAVTLVESQGCKIACIGLTYGINHSGRNPTPNGIPKHLFGRPGHEPDWDAIAELINSAKKLSPDLVVLVAHWGYEYEYWPEEAQRKHAYRLLEMGVDVLLGNSPHVLQPVEVVSIDGWNPDLPTQVSRGGAPRSGVIAYSLGNFASVMPTLACQVGAILDLDFQITAEGGLDLGKIKAHPTVSLRGKHNTWLDMRTFALNELSELGLEHTATRAWAHARELLGPIVSFPTLAPRLIRSIPMKSNSPLERLSQIPAETAQVVARAHEGITTSEYKSFLNTMYHYTLRSQERLEHAAELSPSIDLRDFFSELASEEASHYVLAEADLKAMGGALDRETTPMSVQSFEKYWATITSRDFGKFLGALYVLESVGDHLLKTAAVNMAALKLTKLQARFVLVHLKEDVAHGQRTRELCEKYMKTHGADIIAGAEEASRHWAAIMCEGFASPRKSA